MVNASPLAWDFHCHLDLFPNPVAAFNQAEQERLFTLTMTTTPQAWEQNVQWAEGNKYVSVGLGLHPELVADRGYEFDQLREMLPQTRFVGEIGIDGSPQYRPSYVRQKYIFETVINDCNQLGDKVISIHSRRALKDVLDTLENVQRREDVYYILHWFSGSKAQAEQAVKLGCYFSINESMLLNERSLKVLSELPIDRLLTETDEPFRTDEPHMRLDQLNRSISILGSHLGLQKAQMHERLHQNSMRLVRL